MDGSLRGNKGKIIQTLIFATTQHNVDTAEEMFRKSAAWRRQKGVDRIISWKPPSILRKYYPGGFAGFDGEGCPVWIIPFGHADVKGWFA